MNEQAEAQEPQQLVEPPFFKITLDGENYKLDTNMGPYFKWHILVLAAEIKKSL
jgi:hypothetical protein